jgi:hypothetical protein
MSKAIDLSRVRRALATLDWLVARFPALRAPTARSRLAKTLDDVEEEGDRGSHGDEEEER